MRTKTGEQDNPLSPENLRKAVRRLAALPCPSEVILEQYVRRTLPTDTLENVAGHSVACERCRQICTTIELSLLR